MTAYSECGGSTFTGTAFTPFATSCVTACQNINTIDDICGTTNFTCFCDYMLTDGPVCSSCIGSRNATAAGFLSSDISTCNSLVSPSLTNHPNANTTAPGATITFSGAVPTTKASSSAGRAAAVEKGVVGIGFLLWLGILS